jgi:DNA-binding transcriptional LysR family regulator
MNLDIKQMQYLLTIAETGNFTRAAKILYTSQPSLSTFVSKVEAELGVQIFDRSTSPMALTAAGEIYIGELKQICVQADALDERMRDIVDNKMGVLKVGFPIERAASMLPHILPAFKKIYPNIEVKIAAVSSREMKEMIDDRRLSMGIIPLTGGTAGLECVHICEEELFLVDGCGYITEEHLIEGHPDCVDIAKLDGMELVSLKTNHAIRLFQDELFKKYGIKPKHITEVPSNSAAYRLVSTGTGVAIIPELTIDMVRNMGEVRTYRLSSTGTHWTVAAVSSKERPLGQVEKDFITCMQTEMNRTISNSLT